MLSNMTRVAARGYATASAPVNGFVGAIGNTPLVGVSFLLKLKLIMSDPSESSFGRDGQ